MEIISKYSGLFAILVYSLILMIIVMVNKIRNKKVEDDVVKNDTHEFKQLDLNDEDAVVASIIASIECRNEYHKNVQVLSVRRIS